MTFQFLSTPKSYAFGKTLKNTQHEQNKLYDILYNDFLIP